MTDRIAHNRRTAAVLFCAAGFMVVFVGVVVGAVADAVGLLAGAAVVVAAGLAGVAYFASAGIALGLAHAEPATDGDYPRYHNLVEGLCVAAGVPKPGLYVIDDPALNAFAIGRNPNHGALVVTTGLLERLNRVELEGVIAHELAHIRAYDTQVTTVAVTLVGLVFGPLLRWALAGRREESADTTGVSLTRYPPGLASALEKLRSDDTDLRRVSKATSHLWIAQPPLEERIRNLRSM